MTQLALIRGLPLLDSTLEIRQILFGYAHCLSLIFNQDIHHAIGNLKRHRTDFLRGIDPQTAALDHGGSTHGDGGILGGDDDITTSQQRGIASETTTMINTNHRYGPR